MNVCLMHMSSTLATTGLYATRGVEMAQRGKMTDKYSNLISDYKHVPSFYLTSNREFRVQIVEEGLKF